MLPFAIILEGGGGSLDVDAVAVEKPKKKKRPGPQGGRDNLNSLDCAARSTRGRFRRTNRDTIPGSEEWECDLLFPNGDLN